MSRSALLGKEAEESLGRANIVINRNAIPFDQKPPRVASGMRLGTPSITTRGMDESAVDNVGKLILKVLSNIGDESIEKDVRNDVLDLVGNYPVPQLPQFS